MEVCTGTRNDRHAEIVHGETYCPLCLAIEDVQNGENIIKKLREDLDEQSSGV